MEVNNNNITEGYMDKFVDILKGNKYLFTVLHIYTGGVSKKSIFRV